MSPYHGGPLPENQPQIDNMRKALQACSKRNGILEKVVRELISFGEPPYSVAIFVGLSEIKESEHKQEIRKVLGLEIDYDKCYLLTEGAEVVGTVSKELGAKLKPGELVMVTGRNAVVDVIPETEIKHLKVVSEGTVHRALGDIIVVSDDRGSRVRGVIHSDTLREKIKDKPIQEGDRVLLFGSCILDVIERAEADKQVNIRPAKFSDIGGLEDKIQEIRDVMGLDFDPECKRAINMDPNKGVVLIGPPGVGKTLIVRAIAFELGYFFVLINGADFEDMFVGMSQKELRKRLDSALKHRPSLVFFDEVEAAFPVRGTSVGLEHKNDNLAAFNTFVDGVENTEGVFLILGSNRIDKVDPAVIRSGRMTKKVEIPRPNQKGAASILRIYLSRHPFAEGEKDVLVEKYAAAMVGEIFLRKKSTLLFTAFTDTEEKPYYFCDFVSGSLLKGIVDEIVLRALKRLTAAGVKPNDPAFGIAEADLKGVVSHMFLQEIPRDRKSRNEWLMVNNYPRADEFRDGDAISKKS